MGQKFSDHGDEQQRDIQGHRPGALVDEQQRSTQGGCVRVIRRDWQPFALRWTARAAPSLPPAAALGAALLLRDGRVRLAWRGMHTGSRGANDSAGFAA